MKKILKNKFNVVLCIVIVILTITMLFYENQKEGFNEDEIFSYGSSNYAYDNLFQPYGDMDIINQVTFKYVLKDDWISNVIYYLNNSNEFFDLCRKEVYTNPNWKSREEAIDYVTVSSNEIFNYFSVIWNQSRDVHPPLFYILVHLISSICFGQFSKYIIFFINVIFFVLTCIVIYKIFKLYKKEKLSIIALILYGLSMGAISTVMFQRMYMMLTFWMVIYTYIALKICRNGLKNKELFYLSIVTILGFLTQYYFCVFALIIFVILLIKLKEKKKWILENIKLAILGIVIFPASIYHIFFSYRGIGALQNDYFNRLKFFIEETFREFSINKITGYIILALVLIGVIYIIIKNRKSKKVSEYLLLSLPVIMYYLIISKSAPYLEKRYILPVLPIIAIGFVLIAEYYIIKLEKIIEGKISKNILDKIFYTISILCIIVLQGYGLITKSPDYLYKGYNEYISLANDYNNYQFVYVGLNGYNHIKNIPEFCIYKESLVLNEEQLELLKEIEVEDKFVLCIKNYLDIENVLQKILINTNSNNYKLLFEGKAEGFEANYYLIEK